MIEKIKARRGISQEDVDRELTRRRVVLEWMLKEKIRRYREVALVIRDYYNDPSGTFDKARLGLLS
jgi:flagellar protein FlaI